MILLSFIKQVSEQIKLKTPEKDFKIVFIRTWAVYININQNCHFGIVRSKLVDFRGGFMPKHIQFFLEFFKRELTSYYIKK